MRPRIGTLLSTIALSALITTPSFAADPQKPSPAPAAKAAPAAKPEPAAPAAAAAPAAVAPAEEVPAVETVAPAAEAAPAPAADADPATTEPAAAAAPEPAAPAAAPAREAAAAAPAGAVTSQDLTIGSAVVSSDGVKIGEINRVTSDAKGNVTEIHVTNGKPAGLGVPVMAIPVTKITSGGKDVKVSISSADAKKLPILKDDNS